MVIIDGFAIQVPMKNAHRTVQMTFILVKSSRSSIYYSALLYHIDIHRLVIELSEFYARII